jgi:hypothetical protein
MSMIDRPKPPCSLCGEFVNNCKCEPCETCGKIGCVEHLNDSELVTRLNKSDYVYHSLLTALNNRQQTRAVCQKCGTDCLLDLCEGTPAYCTKGDDLA